MKALTFLVGFHAFRPMSASLGDFIWCWLSLKKIESYQSESDPPISALFPVVWFELNKL